MIEIKNLSKKYGQSDGIIDVSLTAEPGKVTAFLGPNGAGKSTTFRLLLGLDRADSGSALIEGKPYQDLTAPMWTVGAQFDGSGAHKGRTAKAHLTWLAQSNGIPRSRIGEVLEVVGLSDAARKRVGAYSLGMGQRLGIAAALLGDPRIVVLDEPTNGLDPEGIRWIRGLLGTLASNGKTVLISSHLINEVQHVADHIVVISGGRIVQSGNVDDLVSGHHDLEAAYFDWTGSAAKGNAV
ncbi:ABC transporter ATP-binding protein [Paenarthrobacter sp. NPDC091669]|uniref:ABC transporter ATP-binding protein n=1 Tax=Paenarthrobacter sp. NPDC091669 TaxID=3364384 RepID=UPI0038237A69